MVVTCFKNWAGSQCSYAVTVWLYLMNGSLLGLTHTTNTYQSDGISSQWLMPPYTIHTQILKKDKDL